MLCPSCSAENIEGVDECEACGHSMIQDRDVLSTAEQALLEETIADLDPKIPITVSPSTSVMEVLNTIVDEKVGCIVIVEDNKAVGIFSERDVVMKLGNDPATFRDEPISKFMTPDPATLCSTAKIAFAVHRMDSGHFRHIPIVDGQEEVTGIISVRDILRFMTNKIAS